jgi:uncharacterized membrane protein YcjF (UPF0283 family)
MDRAGECGDAALLARLHIPLRHLSELADEAEATWAQQALAARVSPALQEGIGAAILHDRGQMGARSPHPMAGDF